MSEGKINLIAGIIGVGLLGALLIGLVISIGSITFGIIVVIVLTMAITEFWQSAMRDLRAEQKTD
jgi:hypothetical protein